MKKTILSEFCSNNARKMTPQGSWSLAKIVIDKLKGFPIDLENKALE